MMLGHPAPYFLMLAPWFNTLYLQQVESKIWSPAEYEYENDDEGHLDSFDFGFWNETSGAGSPTLVTLTWATEAPAARHDGVNLFRR